jgi:hypothetical protein
MDKKDFEALKTTIKVLGAIIIILQLITMGMFYFGFTRESVEESLMYEEDYYDDGEDDKEDSEETWNAEGAVDEEEEAGETE